MNRWNPPVTVDLTSLAYDYAVDAIEIRLRGLQQALYSNAPALDYYDQDIQPATFKRVTLTVKECNWELTDTKDPTKNVGIEHKPKRKVNLVAEGSARGQVHTKQEMNMVNEYEVLEGTFTGPVKTLQLPLPKQPEYITSGLGSYLTVDLSKNSDKVEEKMTVKAGVLVDDMDCGDKSGATATITTNPASFEGICTASVYPKGTLLVEGDDFHEKPIQDALAQLARKNKSYGLLWSDKGFYWIAKVKCKVQWEFDQTIRVTRGAEGGT